MSHPHHDHVGGLGHLLQINSRITVIVPSFFPVKYKLQLMSSCNVHETFGYEQILENIIVDTATNHLYEQFCVIKLDLGLLLITGCAHPGLDTIIKRVKRYGIPLFGVIGGFHEFRKFHILKDLSFLAPCHCTTYKDTVLKRFAKISHPYASGTVFQI